jgi:hypothetical protein
MRKQLLVTAAAAALMIVPTILNAQSPGAGASGSGAAATSPSTGGSTGGAATGAASGSTSTTTKSDSAPASSSSGSMSRDSGSGSSAQSGSGTGTSAPSNRSAQDNQKAGSPNAAQNAPGQNATGQNAAGQNSANTTGQAGAAGKLTTEQRTQVTSVVKQQNIRAETNVNFSISVGTRVPSHVHFYPVPQEIVTIYPAWRGYKLFRARNEIIIVQPETLEIVAVIPS